MTEFSVQTRQTTLSTCRTQYSGSTIPDWCRRDPLHGAPDWCRDDVKSLAADTMSVISSLKQRCNNKTAKEEIDPDRAAARRESAFSFFEANEDDDEMPYLEGSEVDEGSLRFQRLGNFRFVYYIFRSTTTLSKCKEK